MATIAKLADELSSSPAISLAAKVIESINLLPDPATTVTGVSTAFLPPSETVTSLARGMSDALSLPTGKYSSLISDDTLGLLHSPAEPDRWIVRVGGAAKYKLSMELGLSTAGSLLTSSSPYTVGEPSHHYEIVGLPTVGHQIASGELFNHHHEITGLSTTGNLLTSSSPYTVGEPSHRLASVGPIYEIGARGSLLWGDARSPAVRGQPEPQAINVKAVVQALRDNTISHQDRQNLIDALADTLTKQSAGKRGQQAASIDVQIELNDLYEDMKRKKGREYSQDVFIRSAKARDLWACDVKTFERYRRNVKALRRAGLI